MGGSADRAGRPTAHSRPPPPASAGGLSEAALSDSRGSWPVSSGMNLVLGLHLIELSLNRCSDIFYDFMSGQSVLGTCILAQKHTLHILEVKCGLGIYLDKDACKKCKLS